MTALDIIRDARLRRFADYWLSRRGDRLMPRRRDIDPVDIPFVLPWIWMIDYEAESRRFLCRLAGEQINAFLCNNIDGHYIRGHYLDEYIPARALPTLMERYLTIVDRKVMMHASGLFSTRSFHADGERIAFPLSEDDREVTTLVGATLYGNRLHWDDALRDEETTVCYFPVAELPRPGRPALS